MSSERGGKITERIDLWSLSLLKVGGAETHDDTSVPYVHTTSVRTRSLLSKIMNTDAYIHTGNTEIWFRFVLHAIMAICFILSHLQLPLLFLLNIISLINILLLLLAISLYLCSSVTFFHLPLPKVLHHLSTIIWAYQHIGELHKN